MEKVAHDSSQYAVSGRADYAIADTVTCTMPPGTITAQGWKQQTDKPGMACTFHASGHAPLHQCPGDAT